MKFHGGEASNAAEIGENEGSSAILNPFHGGSKFFEAGGPDI